MLEIHSSDASGFSNSFAVNPGPMGRKLLTRLSCYPYWWVRIQNLKGSHEECGTDPALHPEVNPRSVFPVASAFSMSQNMLLAWFQAMVLKVGVFLEDHGGWGRRDRQEGCVPGLAFPFRTSLCSGIWAQGREQCRHAAGWQSMVNGGCSRSSQDCIITCTLAMARGNAYLSLVYWHLLCTRWAPQTSVRIEKFQGTVSVSFLIV